MESPELHPLMITSSRSVAPRWGIAAMLGLVGVLGYAVHQRFSESDHSWARWEKHELTGVVLGQSPDRKPVTAVGNSAAAPGQRSSVPPLWSKSANAREELQRTPRELGAVTAAPVQGESSGSIENDPFAAGTAKMSNSAAAPAQGAAPRVLFQGELTRTSERAAVQAEQEIDPAFNATQTRGRAAPAGLDFTPSSSARGMDGAGASVAVKESHSARFQRDQQVQQVAGTEAQLPGVGLPEPVPFNRMPATPNSEVMGQAPVPPMQSESTHQGMKATGERPRPSVPELGLDTAIPAGLPAGTQVEAAQPVFGEPALPEPSPTLSSSPLQQQRGLPPQEHQSRMPVQAEPARMEAADPIFSAAPQPEPTRQQQFSQPQLIETKHNDTIPAAGLPRQAMNAPVAAPVAVTPAETPDEVYQVQSGDNYWTISRRYYGSARFFSALAEYNKHRIVSPEKMKPGMYVLVPNVEVLHQRYPQLTGGGPRDPAENAPPGFFVDANGQPCYRVGKGDTLSDIAQKHLGRSSRWVQIQGMNKERTAEGQALKVGTVLRLPGDASQVMLVPADSVIR